MAPVTVGLKDLFPLFWVQERLDRRDWFVLLFFAGFVVLNAIKLSLFNHLIVGTTPSSLAAATFFAATLVKIAFFTFFFILIVRLKYRSIFIVLYILQTLYVAINLQYYFSFQGYLHINQYIGLFSEAFDLITHSAMPWDYRSLFVVADLPCFIGVVIMYPRLFRMVKVMLFKPVVYAFLIFFLIYFYFWDMPYETPLQMMNNRYSSDVSVVKKYGLLTYNIVDLLSYRDARTQIRRFSYGPYFANPVDTAARDTVSAAPHHTPRPNIMIIQVESLDAYIVNRYYRKKPITPFLHELSKHCIYYPYTLSYHAGGSTSDCEFSTLNSVEPLFNYPSIKLRNYKYENSIVSRLARHGYATIAFHGNRGTYFNRSFAFKKIGFQNFCDMFAMNIKEKGWGLPDDTVFAFARTILADQKEPFFYHIITMSSHEPFTLVKPFFQEQRFNEIRDGAMRNYFNSIAYVDRELQRFVTFVRHTHPNTFIFIYGDHTPTLPKCSYKKAVVRHNDRVLEFVPLFIITPDRKKHHEKRCVASFLDVAPSILRASGIPDSIRTHGLNLLEPPLRDKEIPLRGQLYSRKHLYTMIAKKP